MKAEYASPFSQMTKIHSFSSHSFQIALFWFHLSRFCDFCPHPPKLEANGIFFVDSQLAISIKNCSIKWDYFLTAEIVPLKTFQSVMGELPETVQVQTETAVSVQ